MSGRERILGPTYALSFVDKQVQRFQPTSHPRRRIRTGQDNRTPDNSPRLLKPDLCQTRARILTPAGHGPPQRRIPHRLARIDRTKTKAGCMGLRCSGWLEGLVESRDVKKVKPDRSHPEERREILGYLEHGSLTRERCGDVWSNRVGAYQAVPPGEVSEGERRFGGDVNQSIRQK